MTSPAVEEQIQVAVADLLSLLDAHGTIRILFGLRRQADHVRKLRHRNGLPPVPPTQDSTVELTLASAELLYTSPTFSVRVALPRYPVIGRHQSDLLERLLRSPVLHSVDDARALVRGGGGSRASVLPQPPPASPIIVCDNDDAREVAPCSNHVSETCCCLGQQEGRFLACAKVPDGDGDGGTTMTTYCIELALPRLPLVDVQECEAMAIAVNATKLADILTPVLFTKICRRLTWIWRQPASVSLTRSADGRLYHIYAE